ncbi:MAG: hypothetical protein ACTHM8_01295 [Sphingomonas sp.]
MADDPAFFRARAAAEHAAAEAATLDNVRDRATRAEAAWTQMAERAERTREQRDAREATAAAARLAASEQPA